MRSLPEAQFHARKYGSQIVEYIPNEKGAHRLPMSMKQMVTYSYESADIENVGVVLYYNGDFQLKCGTEKVALPDTVVNVESFFVFGNKVKHRRNIGNNIKKHIGNHITVGKQKDLRNNFFSIFSVTYFVDSYIAISKNLSTPVQQTKGCEKVDEV